MNPLKKKSVSYNAVFLDGQSGVLTNVPLKIRHGLKLNGRSFNKEKPY
jgi:hypothetical protein